VCIPPHTPLYSRGASKTAPRWQGLPPASVCSTLRCVRFIAHTSLFSQHVKDSATTAGLAPCERVFHARVCDLQITHISILAARQRQFHDGRTCPCERVFHARVCDLQRTHLSVLAARQRPRHDGCVPRSGVCASNHTHLYSRSTSKTVPRRQGLPPASVCSTLGGVNFSARTSLFSRHVKDRATTAGLAPCERGSPAQV